MNSNEVTTNKKVDDDMTADEEKAIFDELFLLIENHDDAGLFALIHNS